MSALVVDSKSKRANEHVDDLESVFWVILFIAIIRFGVGWTEDDIKVFHDPNHRNRAGTSKVSHLCSRDYRGRFKNKAFAKFLQDLASSWADYHAVLYFSQPDKVRDQPSIMAERLEILDLAKQPSFWIAKFESGIRAYEAEQAEAAAVLPQHSAAASPDVLLQNRRHCAQASAATSFAVRASGLTSRKRKTPPAEETSKDSSTHRADAEGADQPRRSKRLRTMRDVSPGRTRALPYRGRRHQTHT